MTFLAPSFLAIGTALVAIPILIHFLNRRRFKTVEWAAMRYLLAAMKSNRRRLRFESLLLLLARCACLFLLALAVARPLSCQDAAWAGRAGDRVGLHVVVLDDSYSMAYEAGRADARTHLDQAKKVARRTIARLESGAQQVAVVTAARPARVLVRPTHDLDAAAAAVDRVAQSFAGTDLAGAMRLAGTLADAGPDVPSRTLHLVTDCTNSGLLADPQLAAVAQATVPRFRLLVYNLGLANQWNQSVTALGASDALVRVGFDSGLQASVSGFGGGEARLEWKLDNASLPGGATIRPDPKPEPITQSQASFTRAGPVVAEAAISGGDRLRVDDVRRRVIDVVGDLKVLIVEGKRGMGALDGSGAFLRLALAPPVDAQAPGGAGRYVSPVSISDLELPGAALGDYRAVVLAGVGAISPETAAALRAYVEGGGSLLMFMGDAVSADSYNATLGARGLLPGTLVARVDAPATGAFNFDFNPQEAHPVLAAFRNIEKSGLDTAQVNTYWRVQPDAARRPQVVLAFRPTSPESPADPAITLHDVGRGRVVFVATGADAEWSTLVAKPAYVTLVHELLGGAVGGGERWMNVEAGQPIELPPTLNLAAAPVLREGDRPVGTFDRVDRGDGTLVWRSPPVDRPGLYALVSGAQSWPVAVNLDPAEADVRTLDAAGVRRALGEVELDLLGDAAVEDDAASARSVADLSWPILLCVLPLLFAESLMAWRFSRAGRGVAWTD